MATVSSRDSCKSSKAIDQGIDIATLIKRLKSRKFAAQRSLPERVPFKTQVVRTKIPAEIATSCQFGDIVVIVFKIKISKNIKLEYSFFPKDLSAEKNDTILLRKICLLRAEKWSVLGSENYSYLNIEQCPHRFSPTMVERCEVHFAGKGWTTVQDTAEIYSLLEKSAEMLHQIVLKSMSRDACQSRQKWFDPMISKEEHLIASGVLGNVVGTLTQTGEVSWKDRIRNWLLSVPSREFDEVERWASDPSLSKIAPNGPTVRDEGSNSIAPSPIVSESPADPFVILISPSCLPKGKLEVKAIPFSEVAHSRQLWDRVRQIPRSLNVCLSGGYLLDLCILLNAQMSLSEQVHDSKLFVFRGELARPIWQQFDKHLVKDLQEMHFRLLNSEFETQHGFLPVSGYQS